MANVGDYAILSQHVYSPLGKLFNYDIRARTYTKDKKLNEQTDGWYFVKDVDSASVAPHSFYAALYLKFDRGQAIDAVIAIRGTDNGENDIIDALAWYDSVFGKEHEETIYLYRSAAWRFYIACYEYLAYYFPTLVPQITITGHSLGGALAQLLPLSYGFPKAAVAFNSPGCADMSGIELANQHFVYNVDARYGVLNKVGRMLGVVAYVDIAEKEEEAKLLLERLTDTDPQFIKESTGGDRTSFFTLWRGYPKHFEQTLSAYWREASSLPAGRAHSDLKSLNLSAETILAQHSIANMVQALQSAHNRQVAHFEVLGPWGDEIATTANPLAYVQGV